MASARDAAPEKGDAEWDQDLSEAEDAHVSLVGVPPVRIFQLKRQSLRIAFCFWYH